MIGSLPLSKLGLLALLAVVNAALLVVWLGYLEPLSTDLALRHKALRNEAVSLRAPLEKATRDFDQIVRSRAAYEKLLERRFLEPQDRLGAARLLAELRETYGLTSIEYKIAPERVPDDPSAHKSGWAIISTRLTIAMRGMFDTDLIAFTRAVANRLPGQVKPLALSVTRLARPTEGRLAALRDGQPVEFVSGQAVFEWRTLRPLAPEEMR